MKTAAVTKRISIKPPIKKALQSARDRHRNGKQALVASATKTTLEAGVASLTEAVNTIDKQLLRLKPLRKHYDFVDEMRYMAKKLPLLKQRHAFNKERGKLQKQLRKLS